ncbi:unnamed protein product [Trifolium pratense]|uniref:Uncharacterized protein n=1 Tax=Trifolium pratense TaxID=57577 RepID=A0ACB0JMG8_TRIPR|nr:unnamed protein product [Trifolium pratense]
MNLSAPQTFCCKEISKSNVVDDMVNNNAILYGPGEHPDHVVVIKYVLYVGDSKRAMDEYTLCWRQQESNGTRGCRS